MLTIDGAMGEGGGQILRSALALSLSSSRPFRLVNIRAHRDRPGLRPQHLAAVRAAAEISSAEVDGALPDSRELTFIPGRVVSGEYRFSTGTAGSTTLVLQTVLPALLSADGLSRLSLEGGTHNPKAPSFDFLAAAYLPLIARMGPRLEATLKRPGFYPAGGGLIEVTVHPGGALEPLQLDQRGAVRRVRAEVWLSKLPRHIADRERAVLQRGLGLAADAVSLRSVAESPGPGNAVSVFVACEHVCEVITAFGRRGLSAEAVAREAVQAAVRYLDAGVPVGPHLADQLILPMALAGGGGFVTVRPTPHTTTNISVIQSFLPARIAAAPIPGAGGWRIEIA